MNASDPDRNDADRNEDRVAHLESKLTFLEHTVETLAKELEAQQNETRTLYRKLAALQEQLGSLERDPGISDTPDEPPPHY